MTHTLKIFHGGQLIKTVQLNAEQYQVVPAQPNMQFQFLTADGRLISQPHVEQYGEDLWVYVNKGAEQPALILQDYANIPLVEDSATLVQMNSSLATLDSAGTALPATSGGERGVVLASELSSNAPQAAGSMSQASAATTAAETAGTAGSGFSATPLVLGALAVGGIAAAAGGGGGDDDDAPKEPDTHTNNPVVTIDAVNGGKVINHDVQAGKITLTGTVSYDSDVKASNVKLTVTIDGKAYPAQVAAGKWTLTLDGDQVAVKEGTNTVTASASVTDNDGNTAATDKAVSATYQVDTQIATGITLDPVTSDNTISFDESSQNVNITGKVTGDYQAGDTVTLTVGKETFATQVATDGSFSQTVAGNVLTQATQVTASVSDAAGNVFSAPKPFTYKIAQPEINVKLNPVTDDNKIDVAEARSDILVSGTVEGSDAKAGQTIVLQVGNKTYDAMVVEQAGQLVFSAKISGMVLAKGGKVTAHLKGYQSVKGNQDYDVTSDSLADIRIDKVGSDGVLVNDGSIDSVRLSGKLDFSGLFAKGGNHSRIKALNLKIGDATYHTALDEKDTTFAVDVAVADLVKANGQKIHYTVETDKEVYQLDSSSAVGYDHVMEKVPAPKLTENNTTLQFDSNSVVGKNDVINSEQLAAQLTQKITGTVADASVGDSVTVTVGGQTLTTQVAADNTFTVEVKTSDLTLNDKGYGTITATLNTHNLVGNAVSVSDSTTFTAGMSVKDAMQIYFKNAKGQPNRVDSYDDLPYFIQALDVEHYGEKYNDGFAIGERLQNYAYGNEGGTKTITYDFASAKEGDRHEDGLTGNADFSTTNKTVVRDALATISQYIDVKFEETSSLRSSDMDFYLTTMNDPFVPENGFTAGYAYFGGDVFLSANVYGDNKFSGSLGSLQENDGVRTVLHEVMHTLGSDHPFKNAEGDMANAVKLGKNTDESVGATIMSYEDSQDFVDKDDLRIFDLAFLQYRYGVNPNSRAGNDTYGFGHFDQTTTDGGVYIWDGNGVDTFDASQEKNGVYVNLTPGARSYNGTIGSGQEFSTVEALENSKFAIKKELYSDGHDYFKAISEYDTVQYVDEKYIHKSMEKSYEFVDNQVMIGFGTQIENLKGSQFDDTLVGNKAGNVIYGGGGNDTINAGEGNDYLDGGKGQDTLTGGMGDDVYVVDSAQDKVIEEGGQGTDTILSAVSDYTLNSYVENIVLLEGATNATGNAANNQLLGNNRDNVLVGAGGDDLLNGGCGSDTLTGGAGLDTFQFSDLLDGSVDTITDFSLADDKIALAKDVFAGLTTSNVLDYIHYDKTSGALSYDSDAGGSAEAVHFATLTTGLDLEQSHFTFV
ncbi:MAG: hypothetical protein CR974_03275 [Gammaproteobacteria bacterium]|nr:MAG: hypothetical protein CR974_03275 [Gammaproteobacteria bacterium]